MADSTTWSDDLRQLIAAIEAGNRDGRAEVVELRRAVEELTVAIRQIADINELKTEGTP